MILPCFHRSITYLCTFLLPERPSFVYIHFTEGMLAANAIASVGGLNLQLTAEHQNNSNPREIEQRHFPLKRHSDCATAGFRHGQSAEAGNLLLSEINACRRIVRDLEI